ncbi:related to DNA damage-responsive transcriptional repressor RPH1 [Phialocephala subalpina]|uniref:[histone H3]-trimethyl-L-lysine(9) demethylase n=1 Tax=Phialocephala subalpina TaxID=576137 RepID=A0A1L7WMB3_9HELO|nr:related to DNA damage-responsive transcriptional repressor RPH1 [Phialocephala subalpina]
MSADATAMPATDTVPAGLHSPPDSNSARKDGGSDSELSDLEPDHETIDLSNVQPEYISEGNVPVFRPTMEQFKDFQKYLNAVNKWGMKHGIVKVIPPAEWLAAQPRLDDIVKTIKVKEPIKQEIMGTAGTYRQANILHGRSYNLPQWRQLCDQSDHQPPAKRGERRANQEKPVRSTPRTKSSSPSPSGKKKGPGRPAKKSKLSTAQNADGSATPDRLPTPVSPTTKAEDGESVKLEPDDEVCLHKGGRQPKAISVSSRRKNNRRETGAIDEAAFKDFKYELEGETYSQERCDELERTYWRTLTYAPPLYGADMPGTLFDDRTATWNLGKLENILDVLGTKIPGVNTAYLYLGMWKATFAWHLEDVDLYSINYVHFGAPKQWYSISQGDARRFEAAMKNIWPADAKACDQFLRHKTFLISPAHLLSHYNIKVNKIVSHPGEFVITFPYGYHSGYNLGYNCAEAVNFALESWLEYGRVAKRCDCSQAQDSVWIDVREIERKLRGEETDYESTDDEEDEEEEEEDIKPNDLPTPPESSGEPKRKLILTKRKRPKTEKDNKANVKRIRVRIKAPTKEPCILCPNDIPSEPLLPTEDGQQAHRLCALYIPETSIQPGTQETVTDVKYINKARLELKCNYCRSKKGACFQCSKKKCTRAYHATCAAAAGVLVEQGEMAVFGEDGKEYKEWGIEFSCRFHRSKRDKKFDGDALGEDKRILKAASELKKGEVCQMQYYRGDIFAGAVVENRPSEETLLLDILPRGERVEVEYKWLLLPDPSDYHLQKPSANATPMPKSFKAKESLNTSKRQVDDLPRADDKFGEGFIWAEFESEDIARNPFQVKVDVSKEDQIWYYLGRNSTEAKAQFTEDPKKKRHNPKGHFLDTIPKPAPTPLPPRTTSYGATYPTSHSQNSLNASKIQNRPAQPTPTPSKPEKPYVYKPRDNIVDSYRVDPQAYRSQQNFLQRSTPSYSFGTDPRWQSMGSSSPAVSTPPARTAAILPPSANVPSVHRQSFSTSTVSKPTVATASAPPASSSALMAPPHTAYRPTYTPTPPKPANPFGGRTQNSSRPNPFAKYTYLQKEHNRSPLEYKSPYRPGGGFMNGYQGSLEKHLQQTLFRNSKSGSGTPLSSLSTPLLSYGNVAKPSYSSASPTPSAPYTPGTPSYGAYVSPPLSASKPGSAAQVSKPPVNWEKTESSQLHPAIRQDYNTMFHHQYQSPRPSAQYQAPVMQPPAMYSRPSGSLQPPYQPSPSFPAPEPQSQQQTPPPQPSTTYGVHPVSQPPMPQPVAQGQYQYTPEVSQPLTPQYTAQYASTGRPEPSGYQPPAQPQYQAPQPQYQPPPQGQYQENKPLYAHQQYFQSQKPTVQMQVLPQQANNSQTRNLPVADVPADSTSLIEKMLKNLKKATPLPPMTNVGPATN